MRIFVVTEKVFLASTRSAALCARNCCISRSLAIIWCLDISLEHKRSVFVDKLAVSEERTLVSSSEHRSRKSPVSKVDFHVSQDGFAGVVGVHPQESDSFVL